jgi:hypothetical protein
MQRIYHLTVGILNAKCKKFNVTRRARSRLCGSRLIAFSHLKVIGFNEAAAIMFEKADVAINADEGVIQVEDGNFKAFAATAKKYRIWDREPKLRT